LGQGSPGTSSNSSLKVQAKAFLVTNPGALTLQPAIKASFGPLAVDATIPPDLLLNGQKILAVILVRQVRSSFPFVKILFHMPTESNITLRQETAKDEAHCVTAYAFWETKEVRGACLVYPGGFCVAQLKPEPSWFSSGSRSGSSSRETEKNEGLKGPRGNLVEVYFQSRRDQSGQCAPQDSLQRVGVGRGRDSGGTGTPLRRIGSVTLIKTQTGNPTFLRLRLGGAVMIQTSSKPLKSKDVGTFYIFLASASTLGNFTLRAAVKSGLSFSAARPSDPLLWDIVVEPGRGATPNTVVVVCRRKAPVTSKRSVYNFVPKDVSEQIESQAISWRLELPGNVRDVGLMRIYTAPRDFIGLAPLVMTTDILNTAMLTGKMVSVPVKTLAVDTNGTVTDVTNYTNCRSTEVDVLKVSERCNYVFVNGKETKGKSSVMLNFTYGFLSAQLEMSVWMPRLPMLIDIADPELSQIKGWRVPVTTGNRRSTWDSEEDEDMRKGRGCMLQYQLSAVRVLTPFVAQPDSGVLPALRVIGCIFFTFQVDVTNLVRYSLKVADPDVARVQDGLALQGRAVGTTIVQVLSPLTSSVLAERTIRVVDDKVTVTELGVQLVSGLSLSLQLSPGSNRAIVATATTRETITELKQEAVVSCWVQFSDGAVAPLELFDRGVYSLTVSTNDERVATVRRTPLSTFVVAQGEGEGRGRQVRVELRICEECQKSKRKSKLAVGAAILKTNFQSGRGGANKNVEAAGEVKTAVTSQKIATVMNKRPVISTMTTQRSNGAESSMTTMLPNRYVQTPVVWVGRTKPTKKRYGNIDLIRTFKALSDLEIGMYSLIGVSCIAIVAFLLNCASHKLCFRKQKTPVQKGPAPTADPKDHKHDWVWMGGNNHSTPPPGAPAAPAQASTLKREPHRPLESHHSIDSPIDPMANRSATLLARPHRSEPLHSPTSKRNQVQFTTFTTLDIKHLAALKKNGVDLNWANQKAQQPPAQPQTPLPDMPWPVVTPLGEPQ
uniref:Si:dkey-1d7.3 n=1 Tax=Fundulus heteroclitus TaxID=8078 RepID=A0A3Q2QIP6_FUNHE